MTAPAHRAAMKQVVQEEKARFPSSSEIMMDALDAYECRLMCDGEHGWTKVSIEEIKEIGDLCVQERRLFNGCTHAELCQRYGAANVKHVPGVGFFKRLEV